MTTKKFTPLTSLASLGAGGIAVMPFVLMQYTLKHGPGLITRAELWSKNFSNLSTLYYQFLELIMVVFSFIHFALTFWFAYKLIQWLKSEYFKELITDPLKNSAIMAPFISILMTMNLFIGPIRYFFPVMSNNFQNLFFPAMLFWSFLFIATLLMETYLLGVSFKKSFDVDKINFGWLLHPFALGMLSTVGTGIAAMSQNKNIANLAAFMSMISISMGVFLLLVKLIALFKSHFASSGLPEKNFLPSFLIVIPNITLFAISFFRLGHFLERQHGSHLEAYFYLVIGLAFAFEIWYFVFGIFLLFDYFKKNHFKEFYITQWGLICPLVAFVVLGGFAYNIVLSSPILYAILVIVMLLAIAFYFEPLLKHIKCSKKSQELNCEF